MIAGARRRLYITNSYFVPNADFRRLLTDAAARGVDVRILTAGRATDVATTWYAGRRHYDELLRGGVKLYEYGAATLHAKTMTVDGLWGTIGSMNLDNRSLAFNDESTLLVRDRGVAADMDRIFADDLGHAREVTLERFRRRSLAARALERAASLLSALL
jgi:cardiolipin synthase